MFEDPAFWALVALILFLALLVYLKVPGQLAGALDKRAEGIKRELDEARRLRDEAQTLLAEYQRKAREAEREAEDIIDQARKEAAAFADEAKRKSEEQVARRTQMAEQKIGQAEAQALLEVRSLSADLAIAAAERILMAKVEGTTAQKLVADAIGEVKARLH
ncbi:MAG: F0F1 ATP synthase subunit B [Bauldia sp.]|nr:F0F1 ATP synthase subunit B [Bauldia sp.]